jgi:hypothetical protein
MGALTDLSDLVNRLSGGGLGTREQMFFHKTPRINGTAATAPIQGRLHTLWTFDGCPSGGAVPSTAIIPTNTTQGALKQGSNTSGFQKYLYQFGVTALFGSTFIIYDRLFQEGGFSGTTTTAQQVQGNPASPAITRYNTNSTCVGNMILVEIHTAVGGTATTITASYTNQAGTTGRTTIAATFGGAGNNSQSRAILLPLAAGDTGVQAVESVTVLATTGTAGNFAVSIIHPLAIAGAGGPGLPGFRDFTVSLPGIPEVVDGACLALLYLSNITTANEVFGCASLVEA